MKKQGKNLKYRKIFDGHRYIFWGVNHGRLVICRYVIFQARSNGDILWEDEETGEEFEISKDI